MARDQDSNLQLQDRFTDHLLQHGAQECALSFAGFAVVIVVLLGLRYSTVDPLGNITIAAGPGWQRLGAWLALAGAAAAVRYWLIRRHQEGLSAPLAGAQVLLRVLASLAVSSALWGTAVALAIASDTPSGAIPLFVLLALFGVLNASVYAGSPGAALCGFGPGALVAGGASIHAGLPATIGTLAALLLGGFATFLASRHLGIRLRDGLDAQFDLEASRAMQDEQQRRLEKLQGDIKTLTRRRERLEQELRSAQADVQVLEGKSKALTDTLTRVSPVDPVTGLDNRGYFERQVESEWRRAERDGKKISLVLIEFDDFQAYVETYGRAATDTLLKRTGQALRGLGKRAGDTACRYDESRLALLLPHCDVKVAERIAEQLRQRVKDAALPHVNSQISDTVTIHIGVASIKPARGARFNELMKRAESALYEAGFQGGNRVAMYQPLSKLRIEHWDLAADGALSEQAMVQKLLVWGYQARKETLAVGSQIPPVAIPEEHVIGILTGELQIEVEGHGMSLRSGDCVVVPAGLEIGLSVIGARAVIRFSATQLS